MRSAWLFLIPLLTSTAGNDLGDPSWLVSNAATLMQRREIRLELHLTHHQVVQVDHLKRHIPPPTAPDMIRFDALEEVGNGFYKLLTPLQRRRLDGIRYQILGFVSLGEPEVQRALELNVGTTAEIRRIRQTTLAQREEILAQTVEDPRNRTKRLRALSDREGVQLSSGLTQDQLGKLKDLMGTPFAAARPAGFLPF